MTIVTCGCSFSYNLGSLIGKGDTPPAQPAIGRAVTSGEGGNAGGDKKQSPAGAMPTESDLAYARLAMAEAFSKTASTKSTPWENPATGARGTVTAIRSLYRQDSGSVCRDFLASYVRGGNETWLEGAACRSSGGRWTVRRLTPWKQA
jgi:surface antigen